MSRKKTTSIYMDLTEGELRVLDWNVKQMGARQRKPVQVSALFDQCRKLGGDPVAISEGNASDD